MTGEIDAVPADDVPSPRAVADALGAAMNAHDIEAFMALFADDYVSERPAHPDRPFRGTDQVRANWSAAFAGVPDFHADPVATAAEAHTIWTEWSRQIYFVKPHYC